jgi:hypothetical protein
MEEQCKNKQHPEKHFFKNAGDSRMFGGPVRHDFIYADNKTFDVSMSTVKVHLAKSEEAGDGNLDEKSRCREELRGALPAGHYTENGSAFPCFHFTFSRSCTMTNTENRCILLTSAPNCYKPGMAERKAMAIPVRMLPESSAGQCSTDAG